MIRTSPRLRHLFWGSLIIKLAVAAILPLTSDESYYWIWSQHLQLSYYDHPPFVAWLFALGDLVSWWPGSVRWPGVLLSHVGLYFWLLTLARWFTPTQLTWWLTLALLSPLLGGSALIVTPDVPLLAFYGVATWAFFHWHDQPDWRRSLGLGLAVGLGLTSKYMMVLFPMSLLPLVCMNRESRAAVLRGLPWLTLGAVVGTWPVWLWNLQNDFISFKFQAQHGLGRKVWKPSWTLDYVGLQIALVFPPILYWATRARRVLPRYFIWMAWTPLAFFLLTTSRGYVEANWPIVAYPPMLALAVAHYPRGRFSLGVTAGIWGALLATLAGLIIVQPPWAKLLKLREFNQFDGVMDVVRTYDPVYARNYQMAAKLSYELKRPVYKLRGMTRRDFFDALPESEPTYDVYFVIAERSDRLPADLLARGHRKLDTIPVDERYEVWKIQAR